MVPVKSELNKDIFNYKSWFLTCTLILGYAYMHVKLTGVYVEAPLESWLNFSTPLPFGQRQFVPFLARSLRKIVSLETSDIFFIIEFVFSALSFFALRELLKLEFNKKLALLLSWLFFLSLPLCSIINYRLPWGGEAPIFYPYDTVALFFTILGFYLCLKERWFWLAICIFLATLNRESSILLVLLIPALHLRTLKKSISILRPFLFGLFAYVLARTWIYFLTLSLTGDYAEWYRKKKSLTHFFANFVWLFPEQNMLMFMFAFAGLPLFWFWLYDYIPLKYRPIRYIAFSYFLGLFFVGVISEARIFFEIIGLMYLPICIATKNWLGNNYVIENPKKDVLHFLNRYCIIILMTLIIIAHNLIEYNLRQII